MVSKRTRRHDGDDENDDDDGDDDDGVRGLCHKRLRWARALKIGLSALRRFGDMDLRIWKRLCVIQTNGVSYNQKILRKCRRCWALNLVHLCLAVSEILDREMRKIVYKMAASGGTKVASGVKFGGGTSVIKLYLWWKFGDPSSYGVSTLKSFLPSLRLRHLQIIMVLKGWAFFRS